MGPLSQHGIDHSESNVVRMNKERIFIRSLQLQPIVIDSKKIGTKSRITSDKAHFRTTTSLHSQVNDIEYDKETTVIKSSMPNHFMLNNQKSECIAKAQKSIYHRYTRSNSEYRNKAEKSLLSSWSQFVSVRAYSKKKNHKMHNLLAKHLMMATTISIIIIITLNDSMLVEASKAANEIKKHVNTNSNNKVSNIRQKGDTFGISPSLNVDEDLIDNVDKHQSDMPMHVFMQAPNQQKSSSSTNSLNRQNFHTDLESYSRQQQQYDALKAELDELEDQLALVNQNQQRKNYEKSSSFNQPPGIQIINQYDQDLQAYQQDSNYTPKEEISRSSSVVSDNEEGKTAKILPERSNGRQDKNTSSSQHNLNTSSLFIGQLESSPSLQDTSVADLEDDYYPISQASNEEESFSSPARGSGSEEGQLKKTSRKMTSTTNSSYSIEKKVSNSTINKSGDRKSNHDLEVAAQTQVLNSNSRGGFDFAPPQQLTRNIGLSPTNQFQLESAPRPQPPQFNQQDPSTSTSGSVDNVWRPQVDQELSQQYNRARNLQLPSTSRFETNDGEASQLRQQPHHVHFVGPSLLPTSMSSTSNNREFRFHAPGASSGPLISVLSGGDNGGGHHSVTWNPPPTVNPPILGLQSNQQSTNGNQFPLPSPQFGPLSPLSNIQPLSNNARVSSRFENVLQSQPRFEIQPSQPRFENQQNQSRLPENKSQNQKHFDNQQQGPSLFEIGITEAPKFEHDQPTIPSRFDNQPRLENLSTRQPVSSSEGPPSPLFNGAFQAPPTRNSRNFTFIDRDAFSNRPSIDHSPVKDSNSRPQPPPVANFDNSNQAFKPSQWNPPTSPTAENNEKAAIDSQSRPIVRAPQTQLAGGLQTQNKPSDKQHVSGVTFTTTTRSSLDVTTPSGNEVNTTKKEDVVIYYYYYYDDIKNSSGVTNGTAGSANQSSTGGTITEDGLEDTPYMDDPMTVPAADKLPKLSNESLNHLSNLPANSKQQTTGQIQITTPVTRQSSPSADSFMRSTLQNTATTTSTTPASRSFSTGSIVSGDTIGALNDNQRPKHLNASNIRQDIAEKEAQLNKIRLTDLELSTNPPSFADVSVVTARPVYIPLQSESNRFHSQRQPYTQMDSSFGRIQSIGSTTSTSSNVRQDDNPTNFVAPAAPRTATPNPNLQSALVDSVISGGVISPGQRLKPFSSSSPVLSTTNSRAISSSNTNRYGTNNNVALDPYGLDPAAPASLPHSSLSSVDQQRTRQGSHGNTPTSFHLPNYNQRHPNSISSDQSQNLAEHTLNRLNKPNNFRANQEQHLVASPPTFLRQNVPSSNSPTTAASLSSTPQNAQSTPRTISNPSPQVDWATNDGTVRNAANTPGSRRIQPASLPTNIASDATTSPTRAVSSSNGPSRESSQLNSNNNPVRSPPPRVDGQRGSISATLTSNINQLTASSQIDDHNKHIMNKMESHTMRSPQPGSNPNGRASSLEGNTGNSFTPAPVLVSVTSSTSVTSTTVSSGHRTTPNSNKLLLVSSSVSPSPAPPVNNDGDPSFPNINLQRSTSAVPNSANSSSSTVATTTTMTTTSMTATPIASSTSSPSSTAPSVSPSSAQPESSSPATESSSTEGTIDASTRKRFGFGTRRNPFTSRLSSSRSDSSNSNPRAGPTTSTTTTPAPSTTRRALSSTTRRANRQFFTGRRRLGGSDASSAPLPAVGSSTPVSEQPSSSQLNDSNPSPAPSRSRFGANGFRGRSTTTTTTVTSIGGGTGEGTSSTTTQKPNLFTGGRGRPTAKARLPFLRGRQGSEETISTNSVNQDANSLSSVSATSSAPTTQSQPLATSAMENEDAGETTVDGDSQPATVTNEPAKNNTIAASNTSDIDSAVNPTTPSPPATAPPSNDSTTSNDRNRTKLRALFAQRQRNSALFGNRRNN